MFSKYLFHVEEAFSKPLDEIMVNCGTVTVYISVPQNNNRNTGVFLDTSKISLVNNDNKNNKPWKISI